MDANLAQNKKDNDPKLIRHDVGDVKTYLTGVKCYLEDMEKENEKVVKEYHTIIDQFHSNVYEENWNINSINSYCCTI